MGAVLIMVKPYTEFAPITPLTLSIMLACFYSAEPEKVVGLTTWDSQAGMATRARLQAAGLIDHNYKSTARGDVWIKALCAVPLPVCVETWVIPTT
jgi:hypothetical protein